MSFVPFYLMAVTNWRSIAASRRSHQRDVATECLLSTHCGHSVSRRGSPREQVSSVSANHLSIYRASSEGCGWSGSLSGGLRTQRCERLERRDKTSAQTRTWSRGHLGGSRQDAGKKFLPTQPRAHPDQLALAIKHQDPLPASSANVLRRRVFLPAKILLVNRDWALLMLARHGCLRSSTSMERGTLWVDSTE
jgi:hypothetical protein